MSFLFLGGRLAVDLLNTVTARDLLAAPGAAAAWAKAAGAARGRPVVGGAGAPEESRLRAFREELRRGLVGWAATGRPSRRLLALLNRHLALAPEVMELATRAGMVETLRRATGRPVDQLYATVARSAAELLATGEPHRLRRCANPACRLMFYDVSKAGRRRWCSMQTCGARAKVRAFRARRGGRG